MSSHKGFFICLQVKMVGKLLFPHNFYFCLDFFVFIFQISLPKTRSTFLYQTQLSKCQHFPKKWPFPNGFSAPKVSLEFFNQFHLYWQKEAQQDASIHLHATDILQPWDNQDLEHSCTWEGKRYGVFVLSGWQKGEPIEKRPCKPEQKRAFISFQMEKSLHISCRTEVQFPCQY